MNSEMLEVIEDFACFGHGRHQLAIKKVSYMNYNVINITYNFHVQFDFQKLTFWVL